MSEQSHNSPYWPSDLTDFVFMGRAVQAVGRALFPTDWHDEWADIDRTRPDDEAAAPIELTSLDAAQRAVVRACEAGKVRVFWWTAQGLVLRPEGTVGALKQCFWQTDRSVWIRWFDEYLMDIINPTGRGVSLPGFESSVAYLFVAKSDLDGLLTSIASTPKAARDGPAPWQIRPHEQQNLWVFRREPIEEAERRLASKETTKKSINGVLAEMAKACDRAWPQQSIAATRRRGC